MKSFNSGNKPDTSASDRLLRTALITPWIKPQEQKKRIVTHKFAQIYPDQLVPISKLVHSQRVEKHIYRDQPNESIATLATRISLKSRSYTVPIQVAVAKANRPVFTGLPPLFGIQRQQIQENSNQSSIISKRHYQSMTLYQSANKSQNEWVIFIQDGIIMTTTLSFITFTETVAKQNLTKQVDYYLKSLESYAKRHLLPLLILSCRKMLANCKEIPIFYPFPARHYLACITNKLKCSYHGDKVRAARSIQLWYKHIRATRTVDLRIRAMKMVKNWLVRYHIRADLRIKAKKRLQELTGKFAVVQSAFLSGNDATMLNQRIIVIICPFSDFDRHIERAYYLACNVKVKVILITQQLPLNALRAFGYNIMNECQSPNSRLTVITPKLFDMGTVGATLYNSQDCVKKVRDICGSSTSILIAEELTTYVKAICGFLECPFYGCDAPNEWLAFNELSLELDHSIGDQFLVVEVGVEIDRGGEHEVLATTERLINGHGTLIPQQSIVHVELKAIIDSVIVSLNAKRGFGYFTITIDTSKDHVSRVRLITPFLSPGIITSLSISLKHRLESNSRKHDGVLKLSGIIPWVLRKNPNRDLERTSLEYDSIISDRSRSMFLLDPMAIHHDIFESVSKIICGFDICDQATFDSWQVLGVEIPASKESFPIICFDSSVQGVFESLLAALAKLYVYAENLKAGLNNNLHVIALSIINHMRLSGLVVDVNESDFVGASVKKPLGILLHRIVGNHSQFPKHEVNSGAANTQIKTKEIIMSSSTIRLLDEEIVSDVQFRLQPELVNPQPISSKKPTQKRADGLRAAKLIAILEETINLGTKLPSIWRNLAD